MSGILLLQIYWIWENKSRIQMVYPICDIETLIEIYDIPWNSCLKFLICRRFNSTDFRFMEISKH